MKLIFKRCKLSAPLILSLLLATSFLYSSSAFSALSFADQVQRMYVAYYGRPGDPGGIQFWVDKLEQSGGNLDSIIDAFGNSQEYNERFGNLDNPSLVNNIFLQLLGRDADAGGQAFYVEQIELGRMTLGSMALNIADGVPEGSTDAQTVSNKLNVANTYTQAVDSGQFSYSTADDIINAKALLDSVVDNNDSRNSALSTIDEMGTGLDENQFYADNIATDIVQARCMLCHVQGGLSGHTRLVFDSIVSDLQQQNNIAVFQNFLDSTSAGDELILSKVVGVNHGGGTIFSSSSDEYQNLSRFLDSLTGGSGLGNSNGTGFWSGVEIASPTQTLRRASIISAGRLPTPEEQSDISDNSEQSLRENLRGLMSGEGFHQFLIRGANDRLLTDGFFEGLDLTTTDSSEPYYPVLADKAYSLRSQGQQDEWREWFRSFSYGTARAPLELIAYVVENEKPYTEILTADYFMHNPQSAEVHRAGLSFATDDATVFKPGPNRGQILADENLEDEFVQGIGLRIDSHGSYINYPIAGVLNTPAFLSRYPTTETNRNRARSRWTHYHFLGVDIEKSASRTTDPEALADTDNPTLKNPNCTVCHITMDPVAGAFQNYGLEGFYRQSRGGNDSLPYQYKYPEDDEASLYQYGDVWYRDMLAPGFENSLLTDNDNSLQWLAKEITADPRFASATVKFWWPALMGEEALTAPEDTSDSNYAQKLNAYEAQQADIETLATGFTEGFTDKGAFNLKDLLVEMMLTPWFRGTGLVTANNINREEELQDVGIGRLLTPEELEAKTRALTGYAWRESNAYWKADGKWSALGDTYSIYYGGIDSNGITKRSRQLNTIMSNVALKQALEMSCQVVILDFAREDGDRKLFNDISRYITPLVIETQTENVTASDRNLTQSMSLTLELPVGATYLAASFTNDFYDEVDGDRNLIVSNLRVRNANGSLVASYNVGALESIEGAIATTGGAYRDDSWMLWSNGSIQIPHQVDIAGRYTIELDAWGQQAGPDPVEAKLSVEGRDASAGNTNGALIIKDKLRYLHQQMLGEELSINDIEIEKSYELLVELWTRRRDEDLTYAVDWDNETCRIGVEGFWDENRNDDFRDPQSMLGTWISMLVYFMSDYKYLYE